LSAKGVEQIEETCKRLRDEGVTPTIVRYSLAASAIDSADIIGKELKVGRNNLVPEFNFMDPRAIGKWDMLPLDSTQSAVWALDAMEAGNDGKVRAIFVLVMHMMYGNTNIHGQLKNLLFLFYRAGGHLLMKTAHHMKH